MSNLIELIESLETNLIEVNLTGAIHTHEPAKLMDRLKSKLDQVAGVKGRLYTTIFGRRKHLELYYKFEKNGKKSSVSINLPKDPIDEDEIVQLSATYHVRRQKKVGSIRMKQTKSFDNLYNFAVKLFMKAMNPS